MNHEITHKGMTLRPSPIKNDVTSLTGWIRPDVALVDVDGVLADFVGGLADAVPGVDALRNPTTYDYFASLEPEVRLAAFDVLGDAAFWRDLRPIPGALDVLANLRGVADDVWLVTSPWRGCPGWERARRAWVDAHIGADIKMMATWDKYKVPGDVFFDDNPNHVEAWMLAYPGRVAFLVDQPYNRDAVLPRIAFR
jgi:hypothetical protein